MDLTGKLVLVTGAAVRVGRALAKAAAEAGATVIIHYGTSEMEAHGFRSDIESSGGEAHVIQANLQNVDECQRLIERCSKIGPLYGLVNSAAIFEDRNLGNTDLDSWQRHMDINLRAPFLLSKAFWQSVGEREGRIVNILDWRALRPGGDHLPYTVSKAALATLTHSLAIAMAPNVTVNGMALGAILPPVDGGETTTILKNVPAGRWAELDEVGETLIFLLTGPAYMTGEIITLDGGRHLV